jgi:hypothetical protein
MDIQNTLNQWVDEIQFLDMHQPAEWEQVDEELFTAQYSYIKLGLLLTKIRNTASWKYCAGKFESFKAWCQSRVNVAVWQATQYIEAAEIAMYLARTSCEVLPKNLSQCLALRKAYHAEVTYYGERPQLSAAWANVTNHYKPHEITAGKIHATVDPDWLDNQPSKIDRSIVDRAVQQAAERGMTLNEYLGELIGADEDEGSVVPKPSYLPDQEAIEILDALDREFKAIGSIEPKKIMETAVNSFDRLLDNLIGQFIPPVQRVEP